MTESLYHINNVLHTVVGSIALLGALVALLSVKGSDRHKLAGWIFVWLVIVSAVSSLYPTFLKFSEIGPLAIIMAVGTIYLVITAVIAVRYQRVESLWVEKLLPVVPLLLFALPAIRVFMAVKTENYEIFLGPLLIASLFLYVFIQDVLVAVKRQRSKGFWIKRHLTRMIFALSIGVMAVVRIGVTFGLDFEMSVVLPLVGALGLVLFFRLRMT